MTKQLKAPPVSISLTAEELQVVHECLKETLERKPTPLQLFISSLEEMLERAKSLNHIPYGCSLLDREVLEKLLEKNKETIEDYCVELPCHERNVSGASGHLEYALDPENVDDHIPEIIADLKDEVEEKTIEHNDFIKQIIKKLEEN